MVTGSPTSCRLGAARRRWLLAGLFALSCGARPDPTPAPLDERVMGPRELVGWSGPTEGCPSGSPPVTAVHGYGGPIPPLDEDGMVCAVASGAVDATFVHTDVDSVADRFKVHFSTHDFKVVEGEGASRDHAVHTITYQGASWTITFRAREGGFVDVHIAPV